MLWAAEGATTLRGTPNASGRPVPSQCSLNSLEAVTDKDDDISYGEHSEQIYHLSLLSGRTFSQGLKDAQLGMFAPLAHSHNGHEDWTLI